MIKLKEVKKETDVPQVLKDCITKTQEDLSSELSRLTGIWMPFLKEKRYHPTQYIGILMGSFLSTISLYYEAISEIDADAKQVLIKDIDMQIDHLKAIKKRVCES